MKKPFWRRALCALGGAALCAALLGAAGGTVGARSAAPVVLTPTAPGTTAYKSAAAVIDTSNASEGYVMVKYTGSSPKVKLQLTGGGGETYTYTLHKGVNDAFPLTAGDGSYKIEVYEQASGNLYALALGKTINVKLNSPLLPYLYPNQYVKFSADSKAVAKGSEIAAGCADDVAVVQAVYNYVTGNVVYDDAKVPTIKSGYTPDVDETLATGKGICFDYTALMATMLRTQNIPTRLEVGYVSGGAYHAWVSVYLKEQGWVNGIIRFDGNKWTLMDPTFASGTGSAQFVGNGIDYKTKYMY